jgi:hypothetical protein
VQQPPKDAPPLPPLPLGYKVLKLVLAIPLLLVGAVLAFSFRTLGESQPHSLYCFLALRSQ